MSSSLASRISIFSGRRSTSGILSTSKQKPPSQMYEFEINELALETFINSLQLHTFFELTEDEQNERLAKIDALELFRAVQNINRNLGMVQLENYFLIDFLQENDPKLLIGLEKHRATIHSLQGNVLRSLGKSSTVSVTGTGAGSFRSRSGMSRSFKDSVSMGSQKKIVYEYKLNFRAKAEMAEKLANEIEKRLQETEKNAFHKIKLLRGELEEMQLLQTETKETATNFELHFLSDKDDLVFLNNATEKQLDIKFRKFVNSWIKNARALLATMRLKITTVQDHNQHLRHELLTKADLSGILTAIDFEKLVIKRTELLNSLEEQNVHKAGLKGITGRASLSMVEEKQIMTNIEEESKQFNNKTIEVVKAITKLEREAAIVEKENEKDILRLESLRTKLENFEAPSVNQYIRKKDELLGLEKEEKILRRKMYILQMKLDNTQKICKRNIDSNIFINVIEE